MRRSHFATLLGAAYLFLAVISLANWAADRELGHPLLGHLGPIPMPSSLGLAIPLTTIGILFASTYYYSRKGMSLELHAVHMVASILSVSLTVLLVLLGIAEFLDALVIGEPEAFDPGVFAELEVLLGLLTIPILRSSLRELRALRGS